MHPAKAAFLSGTLNQQPAAEVSSRLWITHSSIALAWPSLPWILVSCKGRLIGVASCKGRPPVTSINQCPAAMCSGCLQPQRLGLPWLLKDRKRGLDAAVSCRDVVHSSRRLWVDQLQPICRTRGIGCSCILQRQCSFQLQAVGGSASEPMCHTRGISSGVSPSTHYYLYSCRLSECVSCRPATPSSCISSPHNSATALGHCSSAKFLEVLKMQLVVPTATAAS